MHHDPIPKPHLTFYIPVYPDANLSVVFRLFHVDMELIKSKNNYLLQQYKK